MSHTRSREEVVFEACLLVSPIQRAALLDAECAGDPTLRRAVEELLAAHAEEGRHLETGRMAVAPVDDEHLSGMLEAGTMTGPLPGEWIGRYRLLERLGEGGCGIVYMAEQREPVQRRVALKILKPGMESRAVVVRFEAERQALALMDHPNIARVLDGGTTSLGQPFFVMELVRGRPITEFCDAENLSTQRRIELLMRVCAAVQHAHQKGIIHRDLKPSNVLVTVLDGMPTPKVIDFGIAKATQGRLTDHTLFTAFHQFMGTPAYMSPEQAGLDGVDVDTRSDIYSLGVLLYELLTGTPPFDPKDLLSSGFDTMRRRIREEEPPLPSKRLSTLAAEKIDLTARSRGTPAPRLIRLVKGDLDWIVMKCLEKDRNRRYATANGLAADLGRHLAMEAVTARPPSLWYGTLRAVRRHRVAFGAVLVVALTLVMATSWSWTQARRAERARAETATALAALEKESRRSRELFQMGIYEWRSLLYGLAARLPSQVLSNAANDLETQYSDETESPTKRFLWKANGAFLRSWSGDMGRAIQMLHEATDGMEREFGAAAPDTLLTRMYLGDILLAAGRRDAEVEGLLRTNLAAASAAAPRDWRAIAYAHRGLADIAAARGDLPRLQEHARGAVEGIGKAFGMRSYTRSYQLVLIAARLSSSGLTNEGLAVLSDRLREEEGFHEHLNNLPDQMTRVSYAQQLMQARRLDQAATVLKDGIERRQSLLPGHRAPLLDELTEVQLRRGNLTEALDAARLAYETDTNNLSCWRNLSTLLLRSGRAEEYERLSRDRLEFFAESTAIRFLERVASLIPLGSSDPVLLGRAEELLKIGEARSGPWVKWSLALIQCRRGKWSDAAASAGEIPFDNRREPRQVAARFILALAEAALGHREAAGNAYQQAREAWLEAKEDPRRTQLREWLDVDILEAEARQALEVRGSTERGAP